MKKILAMVMAIVMMMAIAVPAFAAVVNENDEVTNSMDVYVNAETATATYTVTIPADVTLAWGATATAKTYSIDSQLAENDYVKVNAAVSKVLTSSSNETITFTLSGDVTDVVAADEVVTGEVHNFSIDVESDAWDAATIANYTGTITFTAETVTVTPAP